MQKKPIVYIEDCREDIEAMERVVSASSHDIQLRSITTLSQAEEYISALADNPDYHDLPKIIFLDLRLNGLSSLGLLRSIKTTPSLMFIPVLLLSASEQDSDLIECCANAATAYIKKPFNFRELKCKIDQSLDFWLTVAHYPGQWINTNEPL